MDTFTSREGFDVTKESVVNNIFINQKPLGLWTFKSENKLCISPSLTPLFTDVLYASL